MSEKTVLLEIESGIAVLKFNRPKALNALNTEMLTEIGEAMDALAADDSVRVVVLTGEGKAFIAGAAIDEMKDKTPDGARVFSELGISVFQKIEDLEKPVIAVINGFALGGGCELAMACDIRLAGEKAKFGQPEVGLGITPGFGGTQRMSRLVGLAKAKELIFTGRMINAFEAKEIGLVNTVADQDGLMEQAMELAREIAANGKTAVRYAKAALNRGYDTSIVTGLQLERNLFGLCFATADQKEGMTAFLEKRKPNFE
ncbi:MAG: enoyl-CoA hydratase [Clostridiales bacterium]|jgi:enoyl-CoA hydratase|nr:enoyl-CoA hydratase [Clostridiales bacterium]